MKIDSLNFFSKSISLELSRRRYVILYFLRKTKNLKYIKKKCYKSITQRKFIEFLFQLHSISRNLFKKLFSIRNLLLQFQWNPHLFTFSLKLIDIFVRSQFYFLNFDIKITHKDVLLSLE